MERDSAEFRKRILFIIAIASGILGILLLNVYLNQREAGIKNQLDQIKQQQARDAAAAKKMVLVLVAGRDIQPEIPITAADLATKETPEDYLQPGAVTSSQGSKVIGKVALSPILAGEQILSSKIASPAERPKILSEITPAGKRAVPVMVDNLSNLAGLLQPGDYVDVLAIITPPTGSSLYVLALDANSFQPGKQESKVITLPLFQNILVLAVGSELTSSGGPGTGREKTKEKARGAENTVTLSLAPQEAAMVSFVQEQGKIRLLMRSNSDIGEASVKAVNWDSLFDYLYPEAKERGLKMTNTVEIYRGLNKEVIPLPEGKK